MQRNIPKKTGDDNIASSAVPLLALRRTELWPVQPRTSMLLLLLLLVVEVVVLFQMFCNISVLQKITLDPVIPEMKENSHPTASFYHH
jgi:hypothetical protein